VTEIDGYRVDDSYHAVLRHVPMWKPIIAAVNGYCTAGGMEMLGGTDIRLACPEARFAVMEPKRGLIAGGGTTVRLPRQIPWPQAMEFLLCADLIPAGRALAMGLLNEVVPRDELLDRAREYARQIVANSPRAVQATKRSALHGLYIDDDAIARIRSAATELHELVDAAARADTTSGQVLRAAADILHVLSTGLRTASQQEDELADWVMQGEDAIEGPRAFAERRPPDWQPA
jgi:enoyl-CoA hydratase